MIKRPWWKRKPESPLPLSEGWHSTGCLTDNMDLSGILGALSGWGFEVRRGSSPDGGTVQDITHSAANMGLRTSNGDLDDTLASVYWGIKAGRASMSSASAASAADLAAAQRGRQVAIDLLVAHIGRQRKDLAALRATVDNQILCSGQIRSQDAKMSRDCDIWADEIRALERILEQIMEVKSA